MEEDNTPKGWVNREYLGDSLYIAVDKDTRCTILYLDNGAKPYNIIFLEDFVVANLYKYLEKL